MLFFVMLISTDAQSQTEDDSTATIKEMNKARPKEPGFTYFRLGIDLTKITASLLQKSYKTIEAQVDVNFKQNLFLNAEFGFGNSEVANKYIQYTSKNTFLRVGIDKTFFKKDFKADYDNAFVGLRYGIGLIKRDDANYTITDPFWGNSSGMIQGASFMAHWLELTSGFRLEIMKNIFTGWNIRMKTMMNPKKFSELPPAYIAGYGRGDKNTAFGYNLYLLFGFGKR